MKYKMQGVSIAPTPTLRGKAAKKILYEMEHPKDKTELFKKCAEDAKFFKIKPTNGWEEISQIIQKAVEEKGITKEELKEIIERVTKEVKGK